MSAKDPIRIYVTHAFASHTDYHRVFEYLESTANFFYRNCSSPDHPPADGGKEALKEAYRSQMRIAEVVIVLSALYLENELGNVSDGCSSGLQSAARGGATVRRHRQSSRRPRQTRGRGRRMERAGDRRRRAAPSAPRKHRTLGRHRIQDVTRRKRDG